MKHTIIYWLLLASSLLTQVAARGQVYTTGSDGLYQVQESVVNMPYNPPSPPKNIQGPLRLIKFYVSDNFGETDATKLEYMNSSSGMKLHIFHPKLSTGASATSQPLPLIVYGYGGGFLNNWAGNDGKIPTWLAQRGYIVVAPEYRIGINLFDPELAKRAIWRAVQDIRKVINYSRTLSDNNYVVNTTKPVTYVGWSSGGFIGLHNLYLSDANRPTATQSGYPVSAKKWYKRDGETRFTYDLGTLDNPFLGSGGSNSVASVVTPKNLGIQDITVSISGALGDLNWINSTSQVPKALYILHHPSDGVVPYGNGLAYKNYRLFYRSEWDFTQVNGSSAINNFFTANPAKKPTNYQFSIMNPNCVSTDNTCLKGDAGGESFFLLKTWYHNPTESANNLPVMDAILSFINRATANIASRPATATLLSATSLDKVGENKLMTPAVYPNPVMGDVLNIVGVANNTPYRIMDATGREVARGRTLNNRITIAAISSGTYMLELTIHQQRVLTQFVRYK